MTISFFFFRHLGKRNKYKKGIISDGVLLEYSQNKRAIIVNVFRPPKWAARNVHGLYILSLKYFIIVFSFYKFLKYIIYSHVKIII